RNGDWQQALDACRRSRQLVIQGNYTTAYAAQNLTIEAMALFQQGQQAEARAAYHRAAEIVSQIYPYAPGYLGSYWVDWIIYEPTRREAADLLGIHDEPFSRQALARAQAAAADGDWETSAKEFGKVCRSSGTNSNLWQHAAAALLFAEDYSG